MPELSVIVPVYRAENFLNKCVESLVNQTFRDLEVILVEDGSPDRSGELCNQWATKDPRIRVIHQENSGVSAARNRGIREARGDFLGFVDSDDWVDLHMYETLLQGDLQADVIMCDVLTVYEDGRKEEDTISGLPESRSLAHGDCTPELMSEFAGSACRCIYRRCLLQEHGIFFPQGMKVSEDRIFNLYAMGYAGKIAYIKQPLYMRYVNLNSCVNTFHPDYVEIAERIRRETERAAATVFPEDPRFENMAVKQYISYFIAVITVLRCSDGKLNRAQKLREIKKICGHGPLRQALSQTECADDQGNLILKNQILSLYYYDTPFFRKISNVQETWEEGGFQGVIRKCREKIRRRIRK